MRRLIKLLLLLWKEAQVGSGIRFLIQEFLPVNFTTLLPFSLPSLTDSCSFWYGWRNISPCTSKMTKLSLTVQTDDVTSGTRDVDQRGVLRGGSGTNGLISDVSYSI